eukprot:g32928.t1
MREAHRVLPFPEEQGNMKSILGLPTAVGVETSTCSVDKEVEIQDQEDGKEAIDLESCLNTSCKEACKVLWEDLLEVSHHGAERFEASLSLEELTGGLERVSRGKSLRLDGLTVEFVRAFWDITGGSSAHMNYKIFARAFSICLSTMLDHTIHPDQFYTILGRSIHKNIHLVQIMTHYCQRAVLPSWPAEDVRVPSGLLCGVLHKEQLEQVFRTVLTSSTWDSIFTLHRTPNLWSSSAENLDKSTSLLAALLPGLEKMAINRSRQQAVEGLECLMLVGVGGGPFMFEWRVDFGVETYDQWYTTMTGA